MHKQKLLSVTRAILARPTAPFHEQEIAAEIRRQVRLCPNVEVKTDPFGNLIVRYRRGTAKASFAFVAHMDHPGWIRRGKHWEFLGGVPEAYRNHGTKKEFGKFAMWDLPPFELRDGRIYSRACDDLIGCAAIVALFLELERTGAEADVYGVFTRAEEIGFGGAIKLATSRGLPKKITVVSLETSSQSGGPVTMGAGVVVRVGDRTSIFDSSATAAFVQVAAEAKIPFQRALMSGGTCEATAFQLYGFRTAALCVALGNYHNCGLNEQIESEFVSVDDVLAMTRLCVAVATRETSVNSEEKLRRRLEKNARKYWQKFAK